MAHAGSDAHPASHGRHHHQSPVPGRPLATRGTMARNFDRPMVLFVSCRGTYKDTITTRIKAERTQGRMGASGVDVTKPQQDGTVRHDYELWKCW